MSKLVVITPVNQAALLATQTEFELLAKAVGSCKSWRQVELIYLRGVNDARRMDRLAQQKFLVSLDPLGEKVDV